MRKRRLSFLVLSVIVAAILLFTACGGSQQATDEGDKGGSKTETQTPDNSGGDSGEEVVEENYDPLGKYDPPITIQMIRQIEPGRTYMPGETWDNNIWTQAIEEKLGIKFEYLWTAPSEEWDSKVNMAIASDDLPEYMKISYDIFYRLAKAGKLADITDAFDKYAGDDLKSNMSMANGMVLDMLSVDGKLHGLANVPDFFGGFQTLWYRDDWLKNVGLEAPKTIEDFEKMAYAFAKEDPNGNGTPTVGFGVDRALWGAGMGLDGYFAAYGQYPTIWVEKDGQLQFGAVDEGNKEVLLKLQQMYKDGVIDKEFVNLGEWTEAPDAIVQEKIGMVFGPIWFGDWQCNKVMEKHPDKSATWTVTGVPAADGGIAKAPVESKISDGVACMRADAKHPEAMIKLTNLNIALLTGEGTSEGKYHDQKDPDTGDVVNNFFHITPLAGGGSDPMWNYTCSNKVIEALESGDTSGLNDEQMSYYTRSKSFLDGTDLLGYNSYSIFGPGGSQQKYKELYDASAYMANEYYGPNTDNMNQYWGILKEKRDEIFTNIIMGADISLFDEWVNFWNTQGGKDITDEVNAWYADMK